MLLNFYNFFTQCFEHNEHFIHASKHPLSQTTAKFKFTRKQAMSTEVGAIIALCVGQDSANKFALQKSTRIKVLRKLYLREK